MPTRLDPLEYLERSDKWYLGGGGAVCYVPVFPRWLEAPGFWEECHFADVRLERLYTVLLLDENERPLVLRREGRRWTPDALTLTHSTPDGLRVREDKIVTGRDTLASRVTVFNDGKRSRRLHLVQWSVQARQAFAAGQAGTSAEDYARAGDYLTFAHTVSYGDSPYADRPAENRGWGERQRRRGASVETHRLYAALGADRAPVSALLHLAEATDTSPLWQTSPMPEWFRDGRFAAPPPAAPETVAERGHLHLCLHYTLEIAPGETRAMQFGAALHLERQHALLHLQNDLQGDVAARSRADWHAYFAGVPYFECSDPHLQKAYWYRWYGLRLLTVDMRGQTAALDPPSFPHPCVFEGIGGFRSHISFSAPCHMREAIWMHDSRLAFGCMEGLFAAQENSGYLPGHLYLWRDTRGFYHADWGATALQGWQVTGDRSFVERIYPALARYADYFERERDREDSHLYDIIDQGETGQEYSSRYLFGDAKADDWRHIHLKGVDATVYVYRLQRALSAMSAALGNTEESVVWTRKADATRAAVQGRMWDTERQFFVDLDPKSGERSPYRAGVGFYPFLCDLAGTEHLPALTGHLLNPAAFWTPYPVPSSPLDDPLYSAEGDWKGRRLSCPWNGRVWPLLNAHVGEALAHFSLQSAPELTGQAAEFITRFVKMLFFDGDPERPNAFEHYNPETGVPSLYRGVDDYQHSWVIDLLVKYLVGLQPRSDETLVLDPLPFAVERFHMDDLRYRGHRLSVQWQAGAGYRVWVDGVERAHLPERGRVEIAL